METDFLIKIFIMIHKILYAYLFLIQFMLFSQNKGMVNYGQLESMGMGAPIGQDYNAVLIFDNTKSLYIVRNDSLERQHIHEEEKSSSGDNVFVVTKATSKYGLRYFFDLKKDSLYSRDIGFSYVKEIRPEIKWDIKNETKNIGNMSCRKATTFFRGRNYTAWFTTEIPLPFGPWKLQGLPGLIIEAFDTNKEVYFYFKKLKYPIDDNVKIIKPQIQKKQYWKKWIDFDHYRKFLIEEYIKAVNNGLMFTESMDSTVIHDDVEYNLKNDFIENFQIKESNN